VKIDYSVTMSHNNSSGCCITSDLTFLDSFLVSPHRQRTKDILTMFWKPPTSPWLKVNSDGSIVGSHAACGGIFRDHLGTFLGSLSCNIGIASVFDSEVLGYILALEIWLIMGGVTFGWKVIQPVL